MDKKNKKVAKHKLSHKKSEDEQEDSKVVEKQQKASTKYLLFTFLGIILMIGAISTVRFIYTPPEDLDDYDYNSFSVKKAGNFSFVKIFISERGKEYDIELRYGPKELEDGKVVLRDMKSGDESQVDIETITDDPKSVLNLEKP